QDTAAPVHLLFASGTWTHRLDWRCRPFHVGVSWLRGQLSLRGLPSAYSGLGLRSRGRSGGGTGHRRARGARGLQRAEVGGRHGRVRAERTRDGRSQNGSAYVRGPPIPDGTPAQDSRPRRP
ncbi:unnamed protein product, partial [Ectocarpus sp. 4 AP-2014]